MCSRPERHHSHGCGCRGVPAGLVGVPALEKAARIQKIMEIKKATVRAASSLELVEQAGEQGFVVVAIVVVGCFRVAVDTVFQPKEQIPDQLVL